MEKTSFFIEKASLESLNDYIKQKQTMFDCEKYPFKGVAVVPSPLEDEPGVYFLNPVFGTSTDGNGDIIIQLFPEPPTCPYPPGYKTSE